MITNHIVFQQLQLLQECNQLQLITITNHHCYKWMQL